ncbi:MAG: hypothetical protein Q8M98_05195 [Candidatus Cloacimonadaceae bacterium]|nr:hypothetical protein [Candidatus Cloacimonadaceae bacterium]
MKPIYLFLTLLFLLSVTTLIANVTLPDAKPNIWNYLSPLIILIVSPILIRLFKKIGIDISASVLEPILLKIIEIISNVEEKHAEKPGSQKKRLALISARSVLSKHEINILTRTFGSLDTAIQAAFEKSHFANK